MYAGVKTHVGSNIGVKIHVRGVKVPVGVKVHVGVKEPVGVKIHVRGVKVPVGVKTHVTGVNEGVKTHVGGVKIPEKLNLTFNLQIWPSDMTLNLTAISHVH